MSNVAKLKKKAADFEQKKQFDKALAIYVQVLQELEGDEEEGDVALYNRVGDLMLRHGSVSEAVDYYEKAVDLYAEGGFFNNAIALCNKILRQSPGRSSIYYKLGKISAKKGFKSDAKQNFLEYADRMQKAGRMDEAFRALKEFADLCPDQDDIRLMLAEQLTREDRKGEALQQLQTLYEKFDSEGRTAEARATIDRMKAIDPAAEPRRSGPQVAQKSNDLVFLDVGFEERPGRAAGRTPPSSPQRPAPQPVREPAPPPRFAPPAAATLPADIPLLDVDSLETEAAPDDPEVVPAAERPAHVGFERSDDVQLDTDSVEGLDTGAADIGTQGKGAVPDHGTLDGLERTVLTSDFTGFDDAALSIEPTSIGADATGSAPQALDDGTDDADVPSGGHLDFILPDEPAPAESAEGSEFGSLAFLSDDSGPSSGDSRHRADDFGSFDLGGDLVPTLDFGDELEPLAESPERSDRLPMLDLDEDVPGRSAAFSVALPDMADDGFDAPAYAPPLSEEPDPEPAPDEEPELSGAGAGATAQPRSDGVPAGDWGAALDAADESEEFVTPETRAESLRMRLARASSDWGLHREYGEALLETGERDAGLAELESALIGFEREGDLDNARSVAEEIIRVNPNSVRHHQKRVEYAFRVGDKALLAQAYLELADSLFRSGQAEKSRAVYQRVLDLSPDDIRAQAALSAFIEPSAPARQEKARENTGAARRYTAEMKRASLPEPAPAPAAPAASGDDSDFVNLSDWLREDDGPKSTRMVVQEQAPSGDEQADFADMLRAFKQGVAENVEDEDHQSHYDLGIAYKEMGLIDEAISEFQRALRGPDNRARTYEALGNCFLEKGQYQVASSILARAASEPGAPDDQLVGVLYLLGYSYEALQRYDDALASYQRVFGVDIEFRDVGERIAALERVVQ